MVGNYGSNQYKQMAVTTANRGQILIMLYEAGIKNIRKAAAAIAANDLKEKGLAIGKTHDIINELLNSLDFEVGGDIATELERLYNYMIEQLFHANLENSQERLLQVQKLMETLLGAWRTAVDQFNQGKV